jgi:hypothetical protein
MTLKEFAEQYRVRTRRDSCDEEIIPGKKFCSHIYDHGDGRFGLCLILQTPTKWTFAKKRLSGEGFSLRQDGDTEGTLLFDPTNEKQSRAAIRGAGIRYRRVLSEADRIARIARLNRGRTPKERQFLP